LGTSFGLFRRGIPTFKTCPPFSEGLPTLRPPISSQPASTGFGSLCAVALHRIPSYGFSLPCPALVMSPCMCLITSPRAVTGAGVEGAQAAAVSEGSRHRHHHQNRGAGGCWMGVGEAALMRPACRCMKTDRHHLWGDSYLPNRSGQRLLSSRLTAYRF